LCVLPAQAGAKQNIQWNEDAQSQIMSVSELAKLGDAFPTWKIKQITWPSASEITTNSVAADPNVVVECMEWLSKFMKTERLPANLDKHLVAMNNWGLFRKESEQKRLCDVFIARFKKDPYIVHIQESSYNIIIAVAIENLAKYARSDHENFVIETAASILNENLKPKADSENLHVSEVVRERYKLSKIVWLINSVTTVDEKGRTCGGYVKAQRVGASVIRAETDGRFVIFDIRKRIKGKRTFPDPYVERFGPVK